jgi:hypothetical protein
MHQPPLSELHPQGQSQGVFVLTESTLQSIGAHPVLTQKSVCQGNLKGSSICMISFHSPITVYVSYDSSLY